MQAIFKHCNSLISKKFRSVKDVQAAFKKYDRNADGSISKGELHHALTNYKFNFSDQVYILLDFT